MNQLPEEFFIGKIQEGLAISSDLLNQEQINLLLTPVPQLAEDSTFSPETAQKLQAKCAGALSEAYARDTAGKNRDAALQWRENNVALHQGSALVIAGIVQNWYLSVGRAQEKKATGCLSAIICIIGVSVTIGCSVIYCFAF